PRARTKAPRPNSRNDGIDRGTIRALLSNVMPTRSRVIRPVLAFHPLLHSWPASCSKGGRRSQFDETATHLSVHIVHDADVGADVRCTHVPGAGRSVNAEQQG